MTRINFWMFLTIVIISLGGAMLGRTLSYWVQRKITRLQVLSGLLSGSAAVGIGSAIHMQHAGHPAAAWIQVACTLLLGAGILINTRERSRLTRQA